MREIATHQHIDEDGTKRLRCEHCGGTCVCTPRGGKTEPCVYYHLKMRPGGGMVELCSVEECEA